MVIHHALWIAGSAGGIIQRNGIPLICGQIGTGIQRVQRPDMDWALIYQSFVTFFTQQLAAVVVGVVDMNHCWLMRH